MRSDPDLRPAMADELEALFKLHSTVFRTHIEELWGWDEAWQRENFAHLFESSSTSVIQSGGRIVGYVQIDREAKRLFLRNIALQPDVQGQGTGTLLVRQLQQEAEGLGVPIDLVCFRTNLRACGFYERLGFKITGRTDTFIEMSWLAA